MKHISRPEFISLVNRYRHTYPEWMADTQTLGRRYLNDLDDEQVKTVVDKLVELSPMPLYATLQAATEAYNEQMVELIAEIARGQNAVFQKSAEDTSDPAMSFHRGVMAKEYSYVAEIADFRTYPSGRVVDLDEV